MKVRILKAVETTIVSSKTGSKLYNVTDDQGNLYQSWGDWAKENEGQEVEALVTEKEYNGAMQKTLSKPREGSGKSYGKSKEEQESIERQCSLKTAADFMQHWMAGKNNKHDALVDTLRVASAMTAWVQKDKEKMEKVLDEIKFGGIK